jgi:hypothetical protein
MKILLSEDEDMVCVCVHVCVCVCVRVHVCVCVCVSDCLYTNELSYLYHIFILFLFFFLLQRLRTENRLLRQRIENLEKVRFTFGVQEKILSHLFWCSDFASFNGEKKLCACEWQHLDHSYGSDSVNFLFVNFLN